MLGNLTGTRNETAITYTGGVTTTYTQVKPGEFIVLQNPDVYNGITLDRELKASGLSRYRGQIVVRKNDPLSVQNPDLECKVWFGCSADLRYFTEAELRVAIQNLFSAVRDPNILTKFLQGDL